MKLRPIPSPRVVKYIDREAEGKKVSRQPLEEPGTLEEPKGVSANTSIIRYVIGNPNFVR